MTDQTAAMVEITIDPLRKRIRIHRETLKQLHYPVYVQFLVNPEKSYMAVLGSDRPLREALPTGCGLTRPSFAPPSPQSFTAPFSWKTFPLCWEAWIQRILTGCPGRWMGKTGWFISL